MLRGSAHSEGWENNMDWLLAKKAADDARQTLRSAAGPGDWEDNLQSLHARQARNSVRLARTPSGPAGTSGSNLNSLHATQDPVWHLQSSQTRSHAAATPGLFNSSLTCSGSCACEPSSGLPSGQISDGVGDYSNNEDCTWLISSTSAIEVFFSSFNTESGYDYVTISTCASADCSSRAQVARLSGSSVNSSDVFTSDTGFLELRFTSDSSVVRSGFEAEWSVRQQAHDGDDAGCTTYADPSCSAARVRRGPDWRWLGVCTPIRVFFIRFAIVPI